jgi:lipid A 3-O-deacylase
MPLPPRLRIAVREQAARQAGSGRMNRLSLSLAAAAVLGASPASAAEVFGGVLAHDVKTGLTKSGFEDGADIQLGWRGDRIAALGFIGGPSPYVFGSLSIAGDTNFAAAGLSWKLGQRLFVRPGVALAIHNGPGRVVPGDERIDFGARILFAPEIGVGYQVTDRVSVEASWVHLSHGQLFSRQNPGLDSIGVRLNYRFR